MVVRLPSGDDPRAEAAGLCRLRKGVAWADENPLVVERSVFLEVVPATTRRQLDLSKVVAGFAEQRLLFGRVGEEAVVRGIGTERSAGRAPDSIGIPGCRQRLRVISIGIRVEG